ncbi:hypothetical protein D3H65_25180 [Paraflavitalea soli]|uniref:Uncharacterized protein n=1 Tax=Paraflavitalea soli TaxID=2315862 RepID=A0A3B7MVN5_9BACT|nr:hypothetical protein [Paraflavitalea soli]AXY77076.1 hypothetical protein D3H65_25180 [Paraflavitalea soli]
MKCQQPSIAKPVPAPAIDRNTSPVLLNLGDSLEIMRGYNLERIQELSIRLRGLNLMENAREISAVCHEIIRAKQALNKLIMKAGYQA